MPPDQFERLPIIAIGDTAGNEPTGYTPIQQFFYPYTGYYHEILWLCFFGILAYLIGRFIIRPLVKREKA